MNKSGLADSPLFKTSQNNENLLVRSPKSSVLKKTESDLNPPIGQSKTKASNRDTMTPRNHSTVQPRNHDSTVSRYQASTVEAVRRAVKEFGKEAATHRFTQAEKLSISDIVHAYKRKNITTSENEITRIGVNLILKDHKENGKQGILDRVINALNR